MIDFRQLIVLLITFSAGFSLAYVLVIPDSDEPTEPDSAQPLIEANPFATIENDSDDGSTLALERRLDDLDERLSSIEESIEQITIAESDVSASKDKTPQLRSLQQRRLLGSSVNRRLYNVDNLISGGVSPGIAEDIVRRKNELELKKLELQDRARREGFDDTQQYYDELSQIESEDIDLRQELGDDLYDQVLFESKQQNRVRVTSVIPGSEADKAGMQADDIVLSYDDIRVFHWQELKDATSSGSLGEYVNIVISRNGEVFSLAVPRGPLGVQLGFSRVDPRAP